MLVHSYVILGVLVLIQEHRFVVFSIWNFWDEACASNPEQDLSSIIF
jgi:hypothetical protein